MAELFQAIDKMPDFEFVFMVCLVSFAIWAIITFRR